MTSENRGASRTPRWVKVQGAFILLLILLVIAMSAGLIGGHGDMHGAPSDHEQSIGGL